jgi:two-component system, NarL family, response regulator NreC
MRQPKERSLSFETAFSPNPGVPIPRILIVDDHDLIRHLVRRILEARVFIADENESIRHRIHSLLEGHPHIKIVGEATAKAELLAKVRAERPNVIIWDIAAPVLGGLDAVRSILSSQPDAKVLALSTHEEDELVRGAFHAGVRGYILKLAFSGKLLSAVRAVASGNRFLDSRVSEIVMRGYLEGSTGTTTLPQAPSPLTPRERDIVRLLALDNANKRIAIMLRITVRTVETHRANIMRKLNMHSLAERIHYAISRQIINVHPDPSVPLSSHRSIE